MYLYEGLEEGEVLSEPQVITQSQAEYYYIFLGLNDLKVVHLGYLRL